MLAAESLPVEGIDSATDILLVATRAGSVVGAAAVELYAKQGLLRSVVVTPHERSAGLADRLVRTVLSEARKVGVEGVGLLTIDAASYFERFGFRVVDRSEIDGDIRTSREFVDLCPDTATAMWLELPAAANC